MGTLLVMKARPYCRAPEPKPPIDALPRRPQHGLWWLQERRNVIALALVFWAIYGFAVVAWLSR